MADDDDDYEEFDAEATQVDSGPIKDFLRSSESVTPVELMPCVYCGRPICIAEVTRKSLGVVCMRDHPDPTKAKMEYCSRSDDPIAVSHLGR